MSHAAERFDQFLVPCLFHQDGWRRVGAGAINLVAAINAPIIEYRDYDWQSITADRLEFHPGEAECAVPLDRDHWCAADDRSAHRVTHPDAHDAPCAAVEALARCPHVENI